MADRQAVAGKSDQGAVLDRAAPQAGQTPTEGGAELGILGLQNAIGNRAVAGRISEERRQLLADDDAAVEAGQIHKTEFLDRLRSEVCATTDVAMSGSGQDSAGCPHIERWIGLAAGRAAAQVERGIRMFAPEAERASSVEELIAAVKARVRGGAGQWMSGEMDDTISADPLAGAVPSLLFKAREGGARDHGDPRELQRRLGPGRPLDSAVRSRLEPALGVNLGGARVHLDTNAATLSDGLNARAFTVGQHVAFGAGEYRPGTPAGDALIAHEMAHVVQQAGASAPAAPAAALEADADRAAEGVVRQNWLGEVTHNAMPRLRSGLALSRCKKDPPAAAQPAVPKKEDQHEGAATPDQTRLDKLQAELRPNQKGGAAAAGPAAWDGLAGVKDSAKNRADLKKRLVDALDAHLSKVVPKMEARKKQDKVPIASLEGPGRAAKRLVDLRYASFIDVAAMAPGRSPRQYQFETKPGAQTLFDAWDTKQRKEAGQAVDAGNLLEWMRTNDATARTAQSDHHFDPSSPGRPKQETDFWEAIKKEFLKKKGNTEKLELYDQFGFGQQSGDTIIIPTGLSPKLSHTAGAKGEPSPAERRLRWHIWELVTHEYIHTLEHPAFESSTGARNDIMTEGFCEMFTKEVLLEWIPKAPADAQLRKEVEGGSFDPPPKDTIPAYDAGTYADNLKHAENIRDTVIGPPGGENSVRAAFFQGHVEYIGLTPQGTKVAPVAAGLITVPAGIPTAGELARVSNVAEDVILKANNLKKGDPLPKQLQIPGAREHRLVMARGNPETPDQIAKQNNVDEADVRNANPLVDWSAPTEGQPILIPKHN